jgi:hypothetical protein
MAVLGTISIDCFNQGIEIVLFTPKINDFRLYIPT